MNDHHKATWNATMGTAGVEINSTLNHSGFDYLLTGVIVRSEEVV